MDILHLAAPCRNVPVTFTLDRMNRRYFRGLSEDIGEASRPWWRAMSLWGWMLLLFAVFATVAFLAGALLGETFFLPPVKQRSGSSWGASIEEAPVTFTILMIANAVVALVLWGTFVSWIRRRDT